MSGILITAPASNSGKTITACALMAAFQQLNKKVVAAKCGPDYIDPMFHREVLQLDSVNLDLFFDHAKGVRGLYERHTKEADLAIVEGVMGYYDGISLGSVNGSAYEIAKELGISVILVLPCRGMSTSVLALLKGMLEFKEDSQIRGIILNRISSMLYPRMKQMIEEGLEKLGHPEVKVVGYLPEDELFRLESRHLGLVTPAELSMLRERMDKAGALLRETVDLESIEEISERCLCKSERCERQLSENKRDCLCDDVMQKNDTSRMVEMAKSRKLNPLEDCTCEGMSDKKEEKRKIHLAVARDEAFCFYYKENFEVLKKFECDFLEFSPLRDSHLPEGVDGLILGGGYPELYAKELSANRSLCLEIKERIAKGLPCLAECGGFLYLQEMITSPEGEQFPMVGALEGSSKDQGRLTRFGYVTVCAKTDGAFLKTGEKIRGHEFHHWDSTQNGADCIATKPDGIRSFACMQMKGNLMAGFPHLYYRSNENVIERFAQACMGKLC